MYVCMSWVLLDTNDCRHPFFKDTSAFVPMTTKKYNNPDPHPAPGYSRDKAVHLNSMKNNAFLYDSTVCMFCPSSVSLKLINHCFYLITSESSAVWREHLRFFMMQTVQEVGSKVARVKMAMSQRSGRRGGSKEGS